MKAVLLLSGGIDSPVAGHMMLAQGHELILLHMDNRPFTDDREHEKVKRLALGLNEAAGRPLKFYIAKHGEAQAGFAKNTNRHYHCILCRRMMLRVAEELAQKEGACAIVTGESLGQVASQTLTNIKVEEQAVGIPILRPLIGLDKVEIMDMARDLGCYEISTSPGLCCTIVPNKPSTKARLDNILEEEAKIDIEAMVEQELVEMELIN